VPLNVQLALDLPPPNDTVVPPPMFSLPLPARVPAHSISTPLQESEWTAQLVEPAAHRMGAILEIVGSS
jgi:hypothetical protein